MSARTTDGDWVPIVLPVALVLGLAFLAGRFVGQPRVQRATPVPTNVRRTAPQLAPDEREGRRPHLDENGQSCACRAVS